MDIGLVLLFIISFGGFEQFGSCCMSLLLQLIQALSIALILSLFY